MSTQGFTTLREEIKAIVAGGCLMSSAQIYERCTLSDNKPAFHVMISDMARAGEIRRHPAPDGSGKGARFVYGPASSAPAPAAPATPTAAKTAKKRPQRLKGFRAMARTASKARTKPKPARGAVVPVHVPLPKPAHRWALTNDGAFLLLDSDVEIRGAAARALVDFVRVLDKAQA